MNTSQNSATPAAQPPRFISVWLLWPFAIIRNSIIAPTVANVTGLRVEIIYVALGSLAGLALGTLNKKGSLKQRLSRSWVHAVWPIVALGITVAIFGLPMR